ncbi:MAG: hypothetical protein ACTSYO_08195 [Candidatus Ranarchaeia archaeon]
MTYSSRNGEEEEEEEEFRTIKQIIAQVNTNHGQELDIMASLTQREINEDWDISQLVATYRDIRGSSAYLILAAYVQGLHAGCD